MKRCRQMRNTLCLLGLLGVVAREVWPQAPSAPRGLRIRRATASSGGLFAAGVGANYPAGDGMSVIGSETFETEFLPTGWYGSETGFLGGGGIGEAVFDPVAGRNVGQVRFLEGYEIGGAGGLRTGKLNGYGGASFAYRKVYVRMVYRYVPGFENNPSGIQKIYYGTAERSGPQLNYIIGTYNYHGQVQPKFSGIKLIPGVAVQGGAGGIPDLLNQGYNNGFYYAPPNIGSVAFQQSVTFEDYEWHELELVLDPGTPDHNDGWFKIYFDGRLSHDYSGIRFAESEAEAQIRHRFMRWEPIHGGGDYTVTKDIMQRCAVFHMEGVNPPPDDPPPVASLYDATWTVAEDTLSNKTITVKVAAGSDQTMTVQYETFGGTATNGADYTHVAGTLTWTSPDTSDKSFDIPILDDDDDGPDRTIGVRLFNPVGCIVTNNDPPAWSTNYLTIIDDDSPAATHPHEPAGMTPVGENPFDVLAPAGWTEYNNNSNSHPNGFHMTIEQDATAPRSPSNVYSRNLPSGISGGGGNAIVRTSSFSKNEVYVHYWIKLSTNWHGHSSGVNKVGFIGSVDGPGTPLVHMASGSNDNPLRFRFGQQAASGVTPQYRNYNYDDADNEVSPTSEQAEIVRGEWTEIEFHLVGNDPGATNAEIHAWVDQVKTLQFTGHQILGTNANGNYKWFDFYPIWGGTGDTLPVDQEMQIDHAYVSGK